MFQNTSKNFTGGFQNFTFFYLLNRLWGFRLKKRIFEKIIGEKIENEKVAMIEKYLLKKINENATKNKMGRGFALFNYYRFYISSRVKKKYIGEKADCVFYDFMKIILGILKRLSNQKNGKCVFFQKKAFLQENVMKSRQRRIVTKFSLIFNQIRNNYFFISEFLNENNSIFFHYLFSGLYNYKIHDIEYRKNISVNIKSYKSRIFFRFVQISRINTSGKNPFLKVLNSFLRKSELSKNEKPLNYKIYVYFDLKKALYKNFEFYQICHKSKIFQSASEKKMIYSQKMRSEKYSSIFKYVNKPLKDLKTNYILSVYIYFYIHTGKKRISICNEFRNRLSKFKYILFVFPFDKKKRITIDKNFLNTVSKAKYILFVFPLDKKKRNNICNEFRNRVSKTKYILFVFPFDKTKRNNICNEFRNRVSKTKYILFVFILDKKKRNNIDKKFRNRIHKTKYILFVYILNKKKRNAMINTQYIKNKRVSCLYKLFLSIEIKKYRNTNAQNYKYLRFKVYCVFTYPKNLKEFFKNTDKYIKNSFYFEKYWMNNITALGVFLQQKYNHMYLIDRFFDITHPKNENHESKTYFIYPKNILNIFILVTYDEIYRNILYMKTNSVRISIICIKCAQKHTQHVNMHLILYNSIFGKKIFFIDSVFIEKGAILNFKAFFNEKTNHHSKIYSNFNIIIDKLKSVFIESYINHKFTVIYKPNLSYSNIDEKHCFLKCDLNGPSLSYTSKIQKHVIRIFKIIQNLCKNQYFIRMSMYVQKDFYKIQSIFHTHLISARKHVQNLRITGLFEVLNKNFVVIVTQRFIKIDFLRRSLRLKIKKRFEDFETYNINHFILSNCLHYFQKHSRIRIYICKIHIYIGCDSSIYNGKEKCLYLYMKQKYSSKKFCFITFFVCATEYVCLCMLQVVLNLIVINLKEKYSDFIVEFAINSNAFNISVKFSFSIISKRITIDKETRNQNLLTKSFYDSNRYVSANLKRILKSFNDFICPFPQKHIKRCLNPFSIQIMFFKMHLELCILSFLFSFTFSIRNFSLVKIINQRICMLVLIHLGVLEIIFGKPIVDPKPQSKFINSVSISTNNRFYGFWKQPHLSKYKLFNCILHPLVGGAKELSTQNENIVNSKNKKNTASKSNSNKRLASGDRNTQNNKRITSLPDVVTNQTSHNTFLGFCNDYLTELTTSTYKNIIKQSEDVILPEQKPDPTKETSLYELLVSSLVSSCKSTYKMNADKELKLLFKHKKNEQCEFIEKYFHDSHQNNSLSNNRKNTMNLYQKQLEINNKRKEKLKKILKERSVYRSFLISLRAVESEICKVYSKRAKNRKKTKQDDLSQILELCEKRKKLKETMGAHFKEYESILLNIDDVFDDENVILKDSDHLFDDFFV